jgi:hypothetical protein
MSRDKQLQDKKKSEVRQYFSKLDTIQEYGVKKHTTAWCIAKTAEAFFLRPKTIETYIYS